MVEVIESLLRCAIEYSGVKMEVVEGIEAFEVAVELISINPGAKECQRTWSSYSDGFWTKRKTWCWQSPYD